MGAVARATPARVTVDPSEAPVDAFSVGAFTTLFSTMFDAVFICDAEANLRDCNTAAEKLTGLGRAELFELSRRDTPARRAWTQRLAWAVAHGEWSGDVALERDGVRRVADTTVVPVRDDDGAFVGGIVVCRDVTEERDSAAALARAERRAWHDARHDALTGLPNRRALADRFAALPPPTGAALLVIDLDRFKDVNDTLGHDCGDDLLVQVGGVLGSAVRDGDVVARLGGDEFAVLLPGVTDHAQAMALADRVRQALEQPFRVQGIDLDVEASVGVGLAADGDDFAAVQRRADVAMYVAKRQGLGAFAYEPSADGHSPERLSLLGELRGALSRRELVLHFQPKVSLSTGDIVGAEALVRWQHPTRGLVPPDSFIPLAEHTGLIQSLTRYVLEEAVAQQRRWIDAGRSLPVSVNLSARNLVEERLPDHIVDLLRRYGVPPSLLALEITETSIVTEPAHARSLLARLRAIGLRVSIDDFGAGFTSLAVLRNLPVSELKIDRSFIEAMTNRPSDALIVRSVVQLSHNLGLTAVAEGVEDAGVLAALGDMGCDVVQGYHFSRPLPAAAFQAWYERQAGGLLGVSPRDGGRRIRRPQ